MEPRHRSHGCPERCWRLALVCLTLVLTGARCSDIELDRDDELGVDGSGSEDGVELVIVEADAPLPPTPPENASGAAIVYDAAGEFTVQIAITSNARGAGEMVQKLSAQGYPAYALARPDGQGVRVRIGYFSTRGDAVRFGERFQEDSGTEYWVDRRNNEMFSP